MEWANGDIRCNFSRTRPPQFSNVQETIVDFHGYTPSSSSSRDYPSAQTRLDYGAEARPECKPNHCGYPPTGSHTYGITHPNYQITSKSSSSSSHVASSVYSSSERPSYMPQTHDYAITYPSVCTYGGGGGGSQTYLTENEGRSSACVGGSCSECPLSATCNYAPIPLSSGGGCAYQPTDECHVRTELGPHPDIHPEVITSGEIRHPPPPPPHHSHSHAHRHGDIPRGEMELRGEELQQPPECYDTRTIRSHHASHCDLREFEEWREMRGSRESVGTLPPELETHLKQCRCPCDHLGYGNYQ
ncbi:hypothetical protein SK128_025828, partial [Halocaridina rubra]